MKLHTTMNVFSTYQPANTLLATLTMYKRENVIVYAIVPHIPHTTYSISASLRFASLRSLSNIVWKISLNFRFINVRRCHLRQSFSITDKRASLHFFFNFVNAIKRKVLLKQNFFGVFFSFQTIILESNRIANTVSRFSFRLISEQAIYLFRYL